ncbi:MAG TPA: hypothetical protein VGF81_09650 [Solirubrobacteraceae bacterium]
MRRTTLLLAIIAAAGLAACGSSATSSNTAAKSDRMVTFAKCMRAHGVPNFPDPGSNGKGGIEIQSSARAGSGSSMTVNGVSVSAPAFKSAMQSCRSKLPNGGHPPPLSAARKTAMLQFSRCMRENGLPNFPDPVFGSGGQVQLRVGPQGGLDPSSPAFQKAQAACGKYQRGGGFTAKAP